MVRPSLFGAYDLRGVYKEDFDADGAYIIARAFAGMVRLTAKQEVPVIVVNRDTRESSPSLHERVVAGLLDEGVRVIDGGVATSPFHYFVVNHVKADGGIMVTASHLPLPYNGFKITMAEALPVSGTEFQKFFSEFRPGTASSRGSVDVRSFESAYQEFLGITTQEYDEVLRAQSIEFDMDGDRAFFKNSEGARIRPDLIASLLAEDILTHRGASPVVIDVRSSHILRETILRCGGTPVLCPAGHTAFKHMMRKHDALFGAELSGHYYFKDFFFCDSGLFAALRVRDMMKRTHTSIDELILPYQRYVQSGEINIKIKNQKSRIKILNTMQNYFKNEAKISYFDGLVIEYEDWWCSIRASNTEPVLRLNLEATTRPLMEEKLAFLKDLILSES